VIYRQVPSRKEVSHSFLRRPQGRGHLSRGAPVAGRSLHHGGQHGAARGL